MAIGLRSRQALDVIVSTAMRLGRFERVNTAEPKSAPGNGLTCAIWLQTLDPDPRTSGMAITSARLIFMARIFNSFLSEPTDLIDPNILDATDAFIDALHANLDLGGTVLDIDVFGMSGIALGARAGYVKQDDKIYRLMDVTIPVIFDDVWVQVA